MMLAFYTKNTLPLECQCSFITAIPSAVVRIIFHNSVDDGGWLNGKYSKIYFFLIITIAQIDAHAVDQWNVCSRLDYLHTGAI